MRHSAPVIIAAAALICLLPAAGLAALTAYNQNFETLVQASPTALSADGWVVYGNVFTPTGTWLYGYGSFPAPNGSSAFCDIATGQGGPTQGNQQLSVYSDYNNGDHGNGNTIESNVYREMTVTAASVGQTWVFTFDAKLGNLISPSSARAFIKTLNPAAGYALTNYLFVDMTHIPTTWANYSISIPITAGLVGQILQIGFLNQATFYQASGIFYDNVIFGQSTTSGVPSVAMPGAELRQNFPNPFNPSTRIEFSLRQSTPVDVTVFDLAGRHVATLRQGTLDAGDHFVTWNGLSDSGSPAPAGQYRYVLTTNEGRLSRSMMLVK
jgi:hypothetical protein